MNSVTIKSLKDVAVVVYSICPQVVGPTKLVGSYRMTIDYHRLISTSNLDCSYSIAYGIIVVAG